MAAVQGKSYRVTKRKGVTDVYRGGILVGTWPEVGYSVQVFGVCRAVAGTELAAHALAEVHNRNASPFSRRWVLTEAEYEEHRQVLDENLKGLLETYPYTPTEEAALATIRTSHGALIEKGEAKIKAQLLNQSHLFEFFTWDPARNKRPAAFPPHAGDEAAMADDRPTGPRI